MSAEEVRINLAKADALHGLMTTRGVPRHVLRASTVVSTRELSPSHHEDSNVSSLKQLSLLNKSILRPTYGSWLLVIGSDQEDSAALAVAGEIFRSATMKAIRQPHFSSRPFWWPLYGGRYDKLRDDEAFRSGVGRIGLLVMTNLAENSTPEKIEKALDLIHMYASIPRVLLVSGADPLQFALTRLYKRPSRVLFLKKRKVVHQL